MNGAAHAPGAALARLSSETIHASCVAADGRAILITGASGAGKSDLALRLIDRGFALVSDDQTIVRRDGDRLFASPPSTLAGQIEVRGIGIVTMAHEKDIPVALIVELTAEVARMPDEQQTRAMLGVVVPIVSIDPHPPSAASKVAIALDHLGLKG